MYEKLPNVRDESDTLIHIRNMRWQRQITSRALCGLEYKTPPGSWVRRFVAEYVDLPATCLRCVGAPP